MSDVFVDPVTETEFYAGGWHFKARRSRQGMTGDEAYLAWCARTENLGCGPLDAILNDEDVHFHFAATPEGALLALKREVLS